MWRKTQIAIGSGEVWVEIDGPLVFLPRILGAPHHVGHIAEREMGPRVAIIKFIRKLAAMLQVAVECLAVEFKNSANRPMALPSGVTPQ